MTSESQPTELVRDGLNELYAGEEANVDIVFVHGLRGHPQTTWEAFDASDGEKVFWPSKLLPETVPRSRIFSFGYLTEFATFYPAVKPDVIAHTSIDDNSTSLLVKLGNRRRETETTNRPIIFVAHSLGGLVVANGLSSQTVSNEQRQEVAASTCGTIFLGTPFKGSDKAVWAKLAERFLGLFGDSNEQTIKDFDKRSMKLQQISDNFHKLLKQRYESNQLNPIQATCFFETLSTTKTIWRVKKDLGLIVTKQSATLAGDDGMPVNADHCAMCRFSSPQITGYVDLTETIKLMVANWGKKTADRETNGRINIRLGDVNQGDGVVNFGIVSGHLVGTVKDAVSQTVSNSFTSSEHGASAHDAALKAWEKRKYGNEG